MTGAGEHGCPCVRLVAVADKGDACSQGFLRAIEVRCFHSCQLDLARPPGDRARKRARGRLCTLDWGDPSWVL